MNNRSMIKLLKGIWQFCSYLFVPQWGRIKKTSTNLSN